MQPKSQWIIAVLFVVGTVAIVMALSWSSTDWAHRYNNSTTVEHPGPLNEVPRKP